MVRNRTTKKTRDQSEVGKHVGVCPVGNGDALLQDANMHLFDLWVVLSM